MLYCAYVPTFGAFADPALIGEVAVEAERHGWDGVMMYDIVEPIGPAEARGDPVVDPWVAMAVIADRTDTVRIGAMVTPLPRRRPTVLARQTVAIDRLSNGRLILGAGTGVAAELEALGEETDTKTRAAMLDEGLAVLDGLWSGETFSFSGDHYTIREARFTPTPAQSPRIPVWIGVEGSRAGAPPYKRPLARAARWDGVVPVASDPDFFHDGYLTLDQVTAIVRYIHEVRVGDAAFDFAFISGNRNSPTATAEVIAAYEAAGVTWWLENVPQDPAAALDFVRGGPPPR